jgi:FkbM family methyltransferase
MAVPSRDNETRSDVAQSLSTVLTLLLQERTLQEVDVEALSWDRPVLVVRSAHMGRFDAFLKTVLARRPMPSLHVLSHARDEQAIKAMTGAPLTFYAYPTPGAYRLEEIPPNMLAALKAVGFGTLVFLDAGQNDEGLDQVQRLLAAISDAGVVSYRAGGSFSDRANGGFARAADWRRHHLAASAFQRLIEWYHHRLDPGFTDGPVVPEHPSTAARGAPRAASGGNPLPAMTRYLVESGLLRDDPLTIVEAGARGGFNAEWTAFGDSMRVIRFERDEDECARLAAAAPPNVTYIPAALGGRAGEAPFYVTPLEASSGLYRTDMAYFARLLNADNGRVVREERITLLTLDEALARIGSPTVDFVQLDAGGAELDILRGGARVTSNDRLLGLLSEFRFHGDINGCPTFTDLDRHVQPLGFRLYDMHVSHQSRRALPYPGVVDYRSPGGERYFANTTHGQVMAGNALYFRDLLLPGNARVHAAARPQQLLKAAALFEIYSLNDCAAELLLANRARLRGIVSCDDLLDLLTPSLRGGQVGFTEYLATYFDPNCGIVGE